VIIRNPNKISNNLFVGKSEMNIDENEEVDSNGNNNPNILFFENLKKNLDENKSSSEISFGNLEINLPKSLNKSMLKNLNYCNFAFYNCQDILDFARQYSSLLPKTNLLSNKKEHSIIQLFSNFFHPSAIPKLLYGLFLNVQSITLIQKNPIKNYYSLQLFFDSIDDLDTAKSILKKFRKFFINPVSLILLNK
jgi:hypothetical protein